MLVAAGLLIAGLFLGSQYLQHLRGLSALGPACSSCPRLALLIGTRPFAVVGLALVAIGNALLIGVSADGDVYAEALPRHRVRAGRRPAVRLRDHPALGRIGLHEVGLVSGMVSTFNQLGAAICVAVASTVAAVGLTSTPSIEGFTDAYTVFTVVAAVAAVVSLRLVPSGMPQVVRTRAWPRRGRRNPDRRSHRCRLPRTLLSSIALAAVE